MRLKIQHVVLAIVLLALFVGVWMLQSMVGESITHGIYIRERVDLDDETKLRAEEMKSTILSMQEDIRNLANRLRNELANLEGPLPAIDKEKKSLPPTLKGVSQILTRFLADLKNAQHDSSKGYTWVGVFLAQQSPEQLFAASPSSLQPIRLNLKDAPAQYRELGLAVDHDEREWKITLGLHNTAQTQELLAAVKVPECNHIVAVALDLSRLFDRATRSARHLTLITDSAGTLLAYPKDLLGELPTEKKLQNLEDFAQSSQGSAPIQDVLNSSETSDYQSVKWTKAVHLLMGELNQDYPKEKLPQARKDLQTRLHQWRDREEVKLKPVTIPGEVTPGMKRLLLRGHPETLKHIAEDLSQAPELRGFVTIGEIVKCETWFFRLLKVRLDPEDNPGFFFVFVMGASEEELFAGYSEIQQKLFITVFPVVIGALAVALFISWMRTRSLRRLTTAASKITEGDFEACIPVAPSEQLGVVEQALNVVLHEVKQRGKELEEREARQSAILSTAAEGIITFELDGTVESINKAAERLLGYRPNETIGMNGAAFFAPLESGEQINPLTDLESGSFNSGGTEYVGCRKDGSLFPMEVVVSRVNLSDRVIITAIVRDITDRKKIEKERSEYRELLEQQVQERTADLEQKHQELEAARDATENAMKTQEVFLNNVAHDLRTPLTVVIGYSQDLLKQAKKQGQESFINDLELIVNRGNDLRELIDDLLNMTKAINGKELHLEIKPFDVAQMIRKRTQGLEHLAKQNRNELVLDCPDDIGIMKADEVRVWRIIMNLMTNAFKFTRRGIVRLVARRQKEGGDRFIFQVIDSGRGIPPQEQSKLFNRYEQGQSKMKHFDKSGVGLGLSICALYCRVMGGKISVESEPGKGSTFTVDLPAQVLDQSFGLTASPEEIVQARRDETANMVLIIDDDTSVSELMRRNLTEEGLNARTADSGEEGLKLARELQPSAIILDVVLPGIDGWAVLAALKTDPKTADIPIIMASMLDEKEIGKSKAMGAREYLTKPVHQDRLIELIHKHAPSTVRRVLIVEDDDSIRQRLSQMLREQHWEVTEACNGVAAIEQMRECVPDLILLDLLLPVMDGFEVIEKVRQSAEWKAIPVIVITHIELDVEKRRKLQGQVQSILSKGLFGREELLEEIRDLVQQVESVSEEEEGMHA